MRMTALRRWALFLTFACLTVGTAASQDRSALEAAIVAGDADAVADLAAIDGRSDAEIAYLSGRAHLAARKYARAVTALRTTLRLEPNSRRARWYLIQALVGAQDYDAAVFHIDELRTRVLSAEEASRLANLRRSVLARRPFGYSLGVSIQPSSNINRATQNDTLPSLGGLSGRIDNTGEEGISATVSASAYRRFELGDTGTLTATVGASTTRFSDPSFDRYLLNGRLAVRQPAEKGSVTFALEGFRGLYDDEDQDFILFRGGITRQLVLGIGRYSVKATLASQSYDEPRIARRKDNLRGDLTVSASYPFGERWRGSASATLTSTEVEDPRFSFLGLKGTLGLGRNWATGWTLGVSGSLEQRDYQRAFGGVFPFRREDTVMTLGASVGNTRLVVQGFTPVLSCRVQRTRSNIAFYDAISVEECAVSLTRNF